MAISLQFLGAARQVTGSKHLLTANGKRILLDCGMVQGPRKLANEANRNLGLDARTVDAVVLSHGHIDHSGSLPRLVRQGFTGTIHCTHATRDLLGILLRDSARIQAHDAAWLRERGHDFEPPYDPQDVEQTLEQVRSVPYHTPVEICGGVHMEFLDAGHILGSAFVVLDVDDSGRNQRIVFTGDHGRRNAPLLRDPEQLPHCDVLITESTYGDRLHPEAPDMERELETIIGEEMADGGRILIPAFSIGRTQNLLMYLGKLIHAGRIPRQDIIIDSPMSKEVTAVTARHPEIFDEAAQRLMQGGRDPFHFAGVRFVADVEESKALNHVRHGIILSASGMCEGGRILHHLKQTIERAEDCVLTVGFMAEGTLGRKLVEGYGHVEIFGDRYRVRCKVRNILGLSAHADRNELLESIRPLARNTRIFVVHGEERATATLADHLEDEGFSDVAIPVQGETFVL